MDFVTVSTGLILPYWMGLPIRYIQYIINKMKQYEIINNKCKKHTFIIEKNYIYARISYKEGDMYV